MTNNDLRAMAEVLIAAADGKPIEFQEEPQQSWHNLRIRSSWMNPKSYCTPGLRNSKIFGDT